MQLCTEGFEQIMSVMQGVNFCFRSCSSAAGLRQAAYSYVLNFGLCNLQLICWLLLRPLGIAHSECEQEKGAIILNVGNNSKCHYKTSRETEEVPRAPVSNLINIPVSIYLRYHLCICVPVRRSAPSSIIDRIKSFKIKSPV